MQIKFKCLAIKIFYICYNFSMSMDIEDLNKSQIILLTLLVSFVTSIATGIVTVSLMEKAPKDVVRVTQRVVEHVVEKVKDANPIKDKTPTKEKIIEKTVIVKEGDLIAQAIAENRTRLLKLYDTGSQQALAFALPVSDTELISDAGVLKDGADYALKLPDGSSVSVEFVKGGGARSLVMFKVVGDAKLTGLPINLSNKQIKLGQSIFTFVDFDANEVKQGIVSKKPEAGVLTVDLPLTKTLPAEPIFASDGSLVGVSTKASRSKSQNAFISSDVIKTFVESKAETENTDETATSTDGDATQQGNTNTSTTTAPANSQDTTRNDTPDKSSQQAAAGDSLGSN